MSDDELGYCETPDTVRPRCPVHGDAARLERMKAREARIGATRADGTA